MNAVDGLWPEEGSASAEAGKASTSADDPFAPAGEPSVSTDAGDSGLGFFFLPADVEPGAASSRAAGDGSFPPEEDTFATPANEPESETVAHRQSHNRVSIRPDPRRAPPRTKSRGAETAVGKLARAVEGLRELESEMGATLVSADRALRALGGRDTYECAGFASHAELEQRLVLAAPFLQALRVAIRRSGVALVANNRPEQHPKRTTKALVTISRALHRLRTLENLVSHQAQQARQALGDIETERLYEECGYTSFEDFLERALGPSPLLSCAVALVVEPSAPEQMPPPQLTEAPAEAVGFEAPAMLWSAPEPEPAPSPRRSRHSVPAGVSGEPTSENATLVEPPAPEAPPTPTPSTRPRRVTQVVLTVVLALFATGIGAATARDGAYRIAGLESPDASVLGQTTSPNPSAPVGTTTSQSPSGSVATALSSSPPGRPTKTVKPATAASKTVAAPTSTTDATTDALNQALSQAANAAKSPDATAAAKANGSPRKRTSAR